jgi:predicted dehydrogenase
MISRIGIVGLGWWGRQLLDYFREPPRAKVVAACDKSPDAFTGVDLGAAKPYTDLEEFFAREKLDAVVVATPPHRHLVPTRMAAERGIHVFCEKPMAGSVEDCNAMIETCEKNGVVLFIAFKHRYAKAFAYLKQNLGRFGKPLWAVYSYPLWKVGDPGWKFVGEGTRGIIVENVVHAIDVLRYLMGDAERIYGETNTGVAFDYAIWPDSAVFTFRFKNGAIAALGAGCTSDPRMSRECLDIHYERAVARVWGGLDLPYNLTLLMRDEEMPEQHVFEGSDGIREEIRHFIQCVQEGGTPWATGIDGREAVRIALAVIESSREKQPVQLP